MFEKTDALPGTRPTRALRAGAFLCALLLALCTLTTPVGAETAKEKYERLKKELADITAGLDDMKDNKAAAEGYRNQLAQEKVVVEQMIEINKADIAQTEEDLAKKETDIADKREILNENDVLFQERLVAIYKMNNSSVLSQLLAVDSFSELLQVVDAMQRISKHDTDLLAMLAEQRKALEEQQAEIDAMLVKLKDTYTELDANNTAYANNIAAQSARIDQAEQDIANQEAAQEATTAELETAQKEMEAEAARLRGVGSQKGDGSQYVGGVFMWPVPGYYTITCQYGAPDPNGVPHRGMDISGQGGSPAIVACGAGTVITAASHNSYGLYVVIDHGDGVKTLYAHCSSLAVSAGQSVAQGDHIGNVGSTGFSTGPHLHLEVHDGGLQNPLAYLKG